MQYPKVDLEKKHKAMAEGIPRPDSGTGHIPQNLPEEKDLDHPEHKDMGKASERKDFRTTDIGKGPKVGRPEDCKRQPPADAKLTHQEDAINLRNKLPQSGTNEERKESKFASSGPVKKENITTASKMNQDKTFTEKLVEKAAKIDQEKLGETGENYKETNLPVKQGDQSAPLSDENVAPNVNFAANVPGMPYDPNNNVQQGIGTTYYNTEDAAKVGLSKHFGEERKEGSIEKSQPEQKELPTKASKKVEDRTLTEKLNPSQQSVGQQVVEFVKEVKDSTKETIKEAANYNFMVGFTNVVDRELNTHLIPEPEKRVEEQVSDFAKTVKDSTKATLKEAGQHDYAKEIGQVVQKDLKSKMDPEPPMTVGEPLVEFGKTIKESTIDTIREAAHHDYIQDIKDIAEREFVAKKDPKDHPSLFEERSPLYS